MISDHGSSIEWLLLAEKEHTKASTLAPNQMLKHYTAAELNALCNIHTSMPADLQNWERMKDVGKEVLPNVRSIGSAALSR